MRQEALEGMEQEIIPELTEAAEALREVRRQRMDLTKKEVEAADRMIQLLHEHERESYRDDTLDDEIEIADE